LFVPETEYESSRNGSVTTLSTPIPMQDGTGGETPEPPEPAPPGPAGMMGQMPVVSEGEDRRDRPRMDDRTRREVDTLLREQYDAVKKLLSENDAEVHQLARALAEKGELVADDVRRILNGKLPPRMLDDAFESPVLTAPAAPVAASVSPSEAVGVGMQPAPQPSQATPPAPQSHL